MRMRQFPAKLITSGEFKGHYHTSVGMSDDESLPEWHGFNSKTPIECETCIIELKAKRVQFYLEACERYAVEPDQKYLDSISV